MSHTYSLLSEPPEVLNTLLKEALPGQFLCLLCDFGEVVSLLQASVLYIFKVKIIIFIFSRSVRVI